MSYNILDTLSVCSGLGAIASYCKFQNEITNHDDQHPTSVLWGRITAATSAVFALIATSSTISKLAWLCGYDLPVKGAVILGGAALSIAAISAYCAFQCFLQSSTEAFEAVGAAFASMPAIFRGR
jgi:hypothetical protein